MKDYLIDFYNEDMHEVISQDFSRNNKNYDGILNNIINHAGYIYSNFRRTKSLQQVSFHWAREMSIGMFDLADNKTVQELMSKNKDSVFRSHFLDLTQNLSKINKEILKEGELQVPESELRDFYDKFSDVFTKLINEIIGIIKRGFTNKSDRDESYKLVLGNILIFFDDYKF